MDIPTKEQFIEFVELYTYDEHGHCCDPKLHRNLKYRSRALQRVFISDLSYFYGTTIVRAAELESDDEMVDEDIILQEAYDKTISRVTKSEAYKYFRDSAPINKAVKQLLMHCPTFDQRDFSGKAPNVVANLNKVRLYAELAIGFSLYIEDLQAYELFPYKGEKPETIEQQRLRLLETYEKSKAYVESLEFKDPRKDDSLTEEEVEQVCELEASNNQLFMLNLIERETQNIPERLFAIRLAYNLYGWSMKEGKRPVTDPPLVSSGEPIELKETNEKVSTSNDAQDGIEAALAYASNEWSEIKRLNKPSLRKQINFNAVVKNLCSAANKDAMRLIAKYSPNRAELDPEIYGSVVDTVKNKVFSLP